VSFAEEFCDGDSTLNPTYSSPISSSILACDGRSPWAIFNTNFFWCYADFSTFLRPIIRDLALPYEMRFSPIVGFRILRNVELNNCQSSRAGFADESERQQEARLQWKVMMMKLADPKPKRSERGGSR
jgi:hypothetical protein